MGGVEAVVASAYRRFFGAVTVVLCGAVVLGVFALESAVYSTRLSEQQCSTYGSPPNGARFFIRNEKTEGADARFGLWPVGLECEWARVDGQGTIVVTSENWVSTGLLAGGTLGALVGLGVTFAPARRDVYR